MRILSDEIPPVKRQGFIVRQFEFEETRAQDIFDGLFGVFLPIFVFLVDPIVFKGGVIGPVDSLLGKYQLLAYSFSTIQIMMLLIWRTFGRRLKFLAAPISGVFFAGALFSAVIGVVIFPFSLLGMILLIGFLGLVPFVTAFVYLRTGIRALSSSSLDSPLVLAVPAAVIAIALPVTAARQMQRAVSTSVSEILSGESRQVETAASRLRWMPFLPELEMRRIVAAHHLEVNLVKKDALKCIYKSVTGEDIEHKYGRMID